MILYVEKMILLDTLKNIHLLSFAFDQCPSEKCLQGNDLYFIGNYHFTLTKFRILSLGLCCYVFLRYCLWVDCFSFYVSVLHISEYYVFSFIYFEKNSYIDSSNILCLPFPFFSPFEPSIICI